MRITRLALAAVAAAASLAGGHSAAAVSAEPCPAGYYGVIVEHDGQATSVCTNLAHVESCSYGSGVVVVVGGKHVLLCFGR